MRGDGRHPAISISPLPVLAPSLSLSYRFPFMSVDASPHGRQTVHGSALGGSVRVCARAANLNFNSSLLMEFKPRGQRACDQCAFLPASLSLSVVGVSRFPSPSSSRGQWRSLSQQQGGGGGKGKTEGEWRVEERRWTAHNNGANIGSKWRNGRDGRTPPGSPPPLTSPDSSSDPDGRLTAPRDPAPGSPVVASGVLDESGRPSTTRADQQKTARGIVNARRRTVAAAL